MLNTILSEKKGVKFRFLPGEKYSLPAAFSITIGSLLLTVFVACVPANKLKDEQSKREN